MWPTNRSMLGRPQKSLGSVVGGKVQQKELN
jgi:hypothetical protein